MRVQVVRPFKDKHKKVVYQKGAEIEVTKERFEELTSAAPFVKAISKPASEEKKKPAPKKPAKKKTTTKKSAKKSR